MTQTAQRYCWAARVEPGSLEKFAQQLAASNLRQTITFAGWKAWLRFSWFMRIVGIPSTCSDQLLYSSVTSGITMIRKYVYVCHWWWYMIRWVLSCLWYQTKDANHDHDADDSFFGTYLRVYKLSTVKYTRYYSSRMGWSLVGLVVDKINWLLSCGLADWRDFGGRYKSTPVIYANSRHELVFTFEAHDVMVFSAASKIRRALWLISHIPRRF